MTCAAGALLLLLVMGACDEAPAPPPPPAPAAPDDAPPAATTPARPTTQQLLAAPRTRVPLGTLPLSAEVPEGWQVRTSGPLTLLEGPAPSGHAEIQLAHRPNLRRAGMEAMLAQATKDPGRDAGRTVEVRRLGAATVLERRTVGRELADAQTGTSDVAYNWTITVFVPQGAATPAADDVVEVHELNVMGLTRAQYETDAPLLRPIVDSLRLEQAGGAAGGS
jgi:hypothetical protein